MTDPVRSTSRARPITAGIVTALVGFTSSFAVVLTGLRAVGATPEQAASGLLALSVTMGVACVVLAWRYRMPVTAAWSTPGAALLAATGVVEGGWPAAVGAFLVVAALIVLTGLWPRARPADRAHPAVDRAGDARGRPAPAVSRTHHRDRGESVGRRPGRAHLARLRPARAAVGGAARVRRRGDRGRRHRSRRKGHPSIQRSSSRAWSSRCRR